MIFPAVLQEGSFGFPQHMFWLRNKKLFFLLCSLNRNKLWFYASNLKIKKLINCWCIIQKLISRKYPYLYFSHSMVNSFLASGDICYLLITFAKSLDPDQDRHNVDPDLGPNHLTL